MKLIAIRNLEKIICRNYLQFFVESETFQSVICHPAVLAK